ncbi:MAG TPA: alpha/beta fold hydrolase [Actinophytocola sp.]|uniref:alpha/beta fold hydrolase n=1 Tax=Actinophytocola sp. TaxID=1872138 RepID=UPI002DBC13E6|nr:alpha/beta fold hydrolase [Actinophytocola sp.]HEU5475390.1 alpha/beta fold hydrolase [Actinophytocola sp.]
MSSPQLHRIRRGTGAPLLLIMGMGGHHRMWGEPFLSLLEKDFDIVAFDHRGIGTSDRADGPFTIADLAGDAARVLDLAGWDSAHVFGISLGGMVAQELALLRPERVRTLALGCTYPGAGGDLSATGAQRAVGASATRDAELAVRTAFEVNLSARYAADPAHFAAFREVALAVKVPAQVILMQLQAGMGHDAIARLAGITAPTLVMHGTEDEMLAVGNGVRIAELIPNARLELFDGAGHLFWWEDPERTVALLREHAAGSPSPLR